MSTGPLDWFDEDDEDDWDDVDDDGLDSGPDRED